MLMQYRNSTKQSAAKAAHSQLNSKVNHMIKAFWMGMKEFRLGMTTAYDDDTLREWYDKGRDLAHRLTFRHYDY